MCMIVKRWLATGTVYPSMRMYQCVMIVLRERAPFRYASLRSLAPGHFRRFIREESALPLLPNQLHQMNGQVQL